MSSTTEKTIKPVTAVQQKTTQPGFFRKAGDETFFGNKASTFFNPTVQAKLSVSQPGDPQEKEADAVAEKVMRMPEPAVVAEKTQPPVVAPTPENKEEKLQKKEEEEVQAKLQNPASKIQCKDLSPVLSSTHTNLSKESVTINRKTENTAVGRSDQIVQANSISLYPSDIMRHGDRGPPSTSIPFEQSLVSSKGSGSALPADTRTSMEGRFNADFSNVRVHTGTGAEQMSSQINAQAFTHGGDIYFNSGRFSPGTSSGNTLLAHELTHTIQQGASKAQGTVARRPDVQRSRDGTVERRLNIQRIRDSTVEPKTDVQRLRDSTFETRLDVLRSRDSTVQPRPTVQRSPANLFSSNTDLSNISGGSTLPGEAQEYFRNSFQAPVDDIRVHNDMQSLLMCRQRRVRAFAHGSHILFDPSAYSPGTEEGGTLLAKQIANSLKQRGISVPGLESQLSAGIADVKKGDTPAPPKEKASTNPLDGKDKKKAPGKEKRAGVSKGKAGDKKGKKKKGKGSDEGITIKVKKKNPKKSPASPEEDPAFHKAAKKTQATAKKEKVHDPSESKAAAAQKAAGKVDKEAESKAQNRKTDSMDGAGKQDKPFDAEGFKADLLKKVESITPSTLKEATQFKENNKIDKVKEFMGVKVSQEKETSTGPVNQAATQPLVVNEAENKQPVPLPPMLMPLKPMGPAGKDAAPKPKLPNEISMKDQSQSLDDEMKANNVTEDQLVKSNESSFTSALDAKKGAQKDAAEKPAQYQKQEAVLLKDAQAAANGDSSKIMTGIQGAKGKNEGAVGSQQQTAKQKDEESRAKVAKNIEDLYKSAETKVTTALTAADTEANRIFDTGSEAARLEFENYVDVKMRAYKINRYSGFWGGLRWAKDKLFGMPDAVNSFYTEGRKIYLAKMDLVITRVAETVTQKLNEAKQAITEGKTAIDNYVKGLPKELEDVGKEASSNIQDKFDSLDQSINDKRDQLIEGLAKKYVENVKKLDDRISEMKEANKGLVAKAIGFLKKVWAVIKSLKDLFTTILSKLAAIIGTILSSPSGFFSNLAKAFKMGFDNFKNNFLEYLEQGLMVWLTTNLGIAGIELPEKFTPMALFTLALGVMGITKTHIRERAVGLLDEEKVSMLESAGGIIHKIYTEGIGSIWDMIVEKLTDFKEIIWEAIKSFIKKAIIDAALVFLLSMLNPIGAFIKVCMAIYDFLMMLVKFKDRIVELLDTVLSAVTNIASGAVDGAAKMIEKAFAKSIPIIIAFLAALLHLNNVAAKVREIILRIQKRVEKALDWVILKGWAAIGKGVEGALRVKHKGQEMVEKGKQMAVGAGKKAVDNVKGWLGIRRPFKAANGEDHTLFTSNDPTRPVLMVASGTPVPVRDFLKRVYVSEDPDLLNKRQEAQQTLEDMDLMLSHPLPSSASQAQKENYSELIETYALEISEKLAILMTQRAPAEPSVSTKPAYDGTTSGGWGKGMRAQIVSRPFQPGSKTGDGASNPSWQALKKRKNGKSTYYVQGHLLNGWLGGSGIEIENLTPLTRSANTQFDGIAETYIKDRLSVRTGTGADTSRNDTGLLFVYVVIPSYGRSLNSGLINKINNIPVGTSTVGSSPTQITASDKNDLIEIVSNERFVPTALRFDIMVNDPATNLPYKDFTRSASQENPINENRYEIASGIYNL